jgi:hypothetical protein
MKGWSIVSATMRDLFTYGVELGVGIASLALAVPSWQRGGSFRWIAVVIALAGIAAVVHALSRLIG